MVAADEERISSSGMTVQNVEDKIRKAVHSNHARTDEYLKDFDRLRTGFITKQQFERCLDQHFGIVLSSQEEALLISKYGENPNQPGMVNYRRFCEVIDAAFDPNILDAPPTMQKIGVASISSADRRPLSAASLAKVDAVLQRIAAYYKYHGINIKTSYEDFDKHNIGLVTESQFYRSLPGPPDLTESEMRLLAKKYCQENRQGLCNYILFHEDIIKVQDEMSKQNSGSAYLFANDMQPTLWKTNQPSSLQEIFEKIRTAVHKNGIRTTEFFKDHDKLRSGMITENQFICGLSLCCGNQASLSRAEIQQLVDYYKTEDGRMRYKEFCDVMENAFNIPNLERKPTEDVYRPPVGALAKVPNLLSPSEEDQVLQILDRLKDTVCKKRLMLYPYFKDFDRGKCYTRGITKTQFARMLHMVGLDVPLIELELLCKKFEYQVGGDVNYPAFIQSIDPEYIGTAHVTGGKSEDDEGSAPSEEKQLDLSNINVDEVMSKIRHYVLVNGIRVEEYFQDFDPLRHGSISSSRFRMGLSAMNQHHLTDAQFAALVSAYADPRRKGNVLWKEFLSDVEIVFTQRNLEKTPTYRVPTQDVFILPKNGTQDWSNWSDDKKELFDSVIHRIRQKVIQRRILAKPCFQDFDRHNIGYVTLSQFRRCIACLGFMTTETEMSLIAEKFCDDTGFNYLRFLEELEPTAKQESKYYQRLAELQQVNKKQMKDTGSDDIEAIMDKIKEKVVKERVRVHEFLKDYDNLRAGRILKTTFPRALDLCQLELTKKECDILMEWYTSPGHPDYVDYGRFSDDVESVFTVKGLERAPLMKVEQYNTQSEREYNKLDPDAETMLERVMHRLADRVRMRRIQMFPLFEDYDRVHNGSVSRSQFIRVLSELELGSLVSAREFEVLYQKFDVLIGGKHDFNYIAFCDMINAYAHFEYGKP